MPDSEEEPDIKKTRKDVIVHVPTAKAIAAALPPTISIEDRKATTEYIVKQLEQQKDRFEEESRKREKEHKAVVKALDEEREGRKTEHKDAVKWRRISIAVTVLLGSISIYLGYLALLVR